MIVVRKWMVNGGLAMARIPDGWIVTVKADRLKVEMHDSRELITCKNCKYGYFADNRVPEQQCWVCEKYGLENGPDWYCADGKLRERETTAWDN